MKTLKEILKNAKANGGINRNTLRTLCGMHRTGTKKDRDAINQFLNAYYPLVALQVESCNYSKAIASF